MLSILIAEDDPRLRELLSTTLQADNRRILLAQDGQEAIEAAERERPDLIFMDVMMPTINGIEAVGRIKAIPRLRKTPIVMVTSMDDASTEAEARKAGATLFLTKPYDPVKIMKIVELVETALGSSAAE